MGRRLEVEKLGQTSAQIPAREHVARGWIPLWEGARSQWCEFSLGGSLITRGLSCLGWRRWVGNVDARGLRVIGPEAWIWVGLLAWIWCGKKAARAFTGDCYKHLGGELVVSWALMKGAGLWHRFKGNPENVNARIETQTHRCQRQNLKSALGPTLHEWCWLYYSWGGSVLEGTWPLGGGLQGVGGYWADCGNRGRASEGLVLYGWIWVDKTEGVLLKAKGTGG